MRAALRGNTEGWDVAPFHVYYRLQYFQIAKLKNKEVLGWNSGYDALVYSSRSLWSFPQWEMGYSSEFITSAETLKVTSLCGILSQPCCWFSTRLSPFRKVKGAAWPDKKCDLDLWDFSQAIGSFGVQQVTLLRSNRHSSHFFSTDYSGKIFTLLGIPKRPSIFGVFLLTSSWSPQLAILNKIQDFKPLLIKYWPMRIYCVTPRKR